MAGTYWLLGLPFDVTTLEEVRQAIFAAAGRREQLVFATPNVNFIAQAARNPVFREDVLRAGLSLADGMPVVWLGRMLGIPFSDRIAGSDLLDSLIRNPGPRPLRVFFFGGEPGAAEQATRAINRDGGGLVAVGAHYPGFAGIEAMSSEAVIDAINQSGADLLVVALGAAKGHRWIEANRRRLTVPVISHLGAAINFVGGRVRRAPRLMHRLGLEWLWRIKEEPALFRRYARDGWFLAERFVAFAVPEYLRLRLGNRRDSRLTVGPATDGSLCAKVEGRFRAADAQAVPRAVTRIELRNVTCVDAAAVGWLYAARYRRGAGAAPMVLSCDETSRTSLRRWQAEALVSPGCDTGTPLAAMEQPGQ